MKKFFLTLVVLGNILFSQAQANKEDVRKLLELNGSFDVYENIVDQFKNQLSDSKQIAFKKDIQLFVDKISVNDVNRYAAAFSQDEILKLIEFYKSPLGKKLVEKNRRFLKTSNEEAHQNYNELQGIIMKYMM